MVQNKDYMKRIDKAVNDNRNSDGNDPHRLQYHLMPPAGLLNDPNGLIHFNGLYHVFFQWNPFETAHGKKSWGHYTSEDLTHWTLEPAALIPDRWYDKNGCYSGSAVEHDGKMFLFYTGNVKDEQDNRSTYQCLAVSVDGMNFEKKGPVLDLPKGYTPHFRDPKVWKEGGRWLMVIGAQNERGQGEAVLAQSTDLEAWAFIGPIAGSGMNKLKDFGYMWECPDLFHLDGKDVLVVCPQGLEPEGDKYQNLYQAGYFTGAFDAESAEFSHGAFTELDRGFDFYAPQTMLDAQGRRILFGWMGMTDSREQDQPTIDSNWIHALTVPRVLGLKDGKLIQKPAEELEQLRGEPAEYEVTLGEGHEFSESVKPASEIHMDFAETVVGTFEITLRNDIRIVYENDRFVVERNLFSGSGREQRAVSLGALDSLQIFLDHSSVEIFINGGEEVFTSRYFPDSENDEIVLESKSESRVHVKYWPLDRGSISF